MSSASSHQSINSAIQWCGGTRAGGPVLLDFSSDQGRAKLLRWYKFLRSTLVLEVQHRKEFEEPFRHEYILVSLQGGGFCRLDRRGDPAVPTQTLSANGSDAHDTVQQLHSVDGIDSESECLVRLQFNGKIDLSVLLFICFNIRNDPKSKRYTLQRFNCYFFSWTITSTLARRSVVWNTPEQLAEKVHLSATLKRKAVDPIAKQSAKTATDCVSTAFISLLQPRFRQALRKHYRPAGFIPIPILKKLLSVYMNRIVRPRMEAALRNAVESAMTATLESTIESLLNSQSSVMRATLSSSLWFDSVHKSLRKTAQTALRDGVWSVMLKTFRFARDGNVPDKQRSLPTPSPNQQLQEAQATGSTSNDTNQNNRSPVSPKPMPGTRKRRVGGVLDTFIAKGADAIADNSCDTGVGNAWGMSGGLSGDALTYEEWVFSWDDLLLMLRTHGPAEGRAVISDIALTESLTPGQIEIWDALWECTEDAAKACGPIPRDSIWGSIEFATTTVVDVVSAVVFSSIDETSPLTFDASLKKSTRNESYAKVTHSELQEWVTSRIQKHSQQMLRLGATGVNESIREAMGRIWESMSQTDPTEWFHELEKSTPC